MQGLTDGQRFCQRCGTALDGARCPLHGFDVSTQGARSHAPVPSYASPSYTSPSYTSPSYAGPSYTAPPTAPIVPPPIHNTSWSSPASEAPWQPAPAPWSPRDASRPSDRARRSTPSFSLWLAVGLAVLLLVALIGDRALLQHSIDSNHQSLTKLDQRLAAQLAATNALAGKVLALENQSADPAAVARLVRASVFTIDTPEGLGSGWVVTSAGGSSTIVTDYHVIASVWTGSGAKTVQVKQDAKNLTGTITKVDSGDDLAVITVSAALTPLARSTTDAMVGDPVLVVGSPLGLAGTVANGIVSSFRNGLVQFSAPISPGDSGGPVVNSKGQVIGVAESKLVGSGVEGLSFAIPISTVCTTVTSC